MTEFERLRSNQWANTMDLSILKPMARAYMLTHRFNKTSLFNQLKRARLLKKLFASMKTLNTIKIVCHLGYSC